MKNLFLILMFLPICVLAQDDNFYLHCQYDAPWSQISLDGNRKRALQGEVWQIAEALGKFEKYFMSETLTNNIISVSHV